MFDQRSQRSFHRAPRSLGTNAAAIAGTRFAASVVGGSPTRSAQPGGSTSHERHIGGNAAISAALSAGICSGDGQRVLQ